MHRILTTTLIVTIAFAAARAANAATIVGFEDLSLAPNSYFNGNPGGSGDTFTVNPFTSGGITFSNTYTRSSGFEYWNGWSYSNMTNTTTPGFGNQFSVYAGSGAGPSSNFAISTQGYDSGFNDNSITIPTGRSFQSIAITNTTYAALSMRDGDPPGPFAFGKKFGGVTGNDPDFFKLIITGHTGGATGAAVGNVEVYLADYRFANNLQDYILNQWRTVDLTSLAGADTLTFAYDSSDVTMFGSFASINTPLYFAADNLVFGQPVSAAVPEPSSWVAAIVCGFVCAWFYRRTRRPRAMV